MLTLRKVSVSYIHDGRQKFRNTLFPREYDDDCAP